MISIDTALIECEHSHATSNQLGGNVGLQIRKRENEIGFEREDLSNLALMKAETLGFCRASGGRTV